MKKKKNALKQRAKSHYEKIITVGNVYFRTRDIVMKNIYPKNTNNMPVHAIACTN
jgi:hypothetical protein